MGLRSAYNSSRAPKTGGVRRVECILGAWREVKGSHPRVRSVDRRGGSGVRNGIRERLEDELIVE